MDCLRASRIAQLLRLILSLLLWAAMPLTIQAEEQAAGDHSAHLVWDYLTTEDSDQAGRLGRQIEERFAGDLATLEDTIRAGRPYGAQPVGIFPDERMVLRDRTYQYSLYVPESYRPSDSYGLVVCLHGAGFSGDAYIERWQPRLNGRYILVCPSYPMGAWYTRRAEELVLAVIREVERRYHVDPDRVFLTGMSNGGIGAWLIGMHHAPLFAGIAPMASGLDDVLFPFLENLRSTPAYIIHGSHDNVMPVELSRKLDKELDHLGYSHVYREHDRVHPMAGGHFFPREELPALVHWFDTQHRTAIPTSLTVVRDASHLTPFSWARIDATDRIASFSEDLVDKHDEEIRAKSYARLRVEITAPNRIDVQTDHVRQYTLFLNESLVDMTQPVRVLTNGALSYEGIVAPSIETLLSQSRLRKDPGQIFPVQLTLPVRERPS
jgi:poly(3-hydroxybutyrate) depolymerase